MNEPMSDERFAELREKVAKFQASSYYEYACEFMESEDFVEAVDEIVRLRAENERLAKALMRFMADKQQYCIEDGHGCFHGWEWQRHLEDCPVRIAGESLNPEPTS